MAVGQFGILANQKRNNGEKNGEKIISLYRAACCLSIINGIGDLDAEEEEGE